MGQHAQAPLYAGGFSPPILHETRRPPPPHLQETFRIGQVIRLHHPTGHGRTKGHIATAGGALGEREKSALAHSMSHSKATADSYYRAYGEAKSLEGFQAVGNLLEIPSAVKKRQKFTEAQTECLSAHFKAEGAA